MEQKYVEKLEKLKFRGNIDSVKTVLETRAYHNIYDTMSDKSFGVLNFPECYDHATEMDIGDKLTQLLEIAYECTLNRPFMTPGIMRPGPSSENSVQIALEGVLTEEQIVSEVDTLLYYVYDGLKCGLSSNDFDAEKKKLFNRLIRKVLVIRTFLKAGSTSYKYHEYAIRDSDD